MVMTTRQRGQLLDATSRATVADVITATWFDPDEDTGAWGGIVEAGPAADHLRGEVQAGRTRYGLRLEDGREGLIDLGLSEFVADGAPPLTFRGAGQLRRK